MIAWDHDNWKVMAVLSRDNVHGTMKRRIGITLDDPVNYILAIAVQRRRPIFRLDAALLGFGQA